VNVEQPLPGIIQLSDILAERKATAAIYLSKTRAGLATEVGEWADGSTDAGPFVACRHENLPIAIRWLIVQSRITQANESSAAVDSATILQQVQCVRTSLERVKTMNRKVTDVRASANEIQTEAKALRDEVRASANVRRATGNGSKNTILYVRTLKAQPNALQRTTYSSLQSGNHISVHLTRSVRRANGFVQTRQQ
jgi:hypothetical protein